MHRKSLSRFFVLALVAMALMMLVGPASALTSLVWDQDFSVDSSGWFDSSDGGWGTIAVAGGTAIFTGDSSSAPFSRFDAYRRHWSGDWAAEIDVFLDPAAWSAGEGFDYSVASNGSDGAHQRDFIFHVTKDTSTGELLVGGSNNTNFNPREDLENINHYVVSSAGWYTLQHVFRDVGGVLTVDLNLVDAGNNVVFTETRSDPSDLIPSEVGGNRYAWFTVIEVAGGIEVDNHQLFVDVPVVSPVGDTAICDPGTVNIQIDDVNHLYGYEFIVEYDKDLVTAVGSFDNSWFDPGNKGFPGPGSPVNWQADCDDGTGECRFAYTRGTQDPELATSTPETIASIQFTSLLGDAGSFPVTVRDVKLTDKDSFEIPGAIAGSLTVNVCGTATVSGKISLQGRPQPGRPFISEAPAVFTVELTGGYGPYMGVVNETNGTYTITGVKYDVGGTEYTLSADHSVYLRADELAFLVDGNITDKNTRLLGGNANGDFRVDTLDLTCIGGQFGSITPPFTCDAMPQTADVNDDLKVNIQDLSLAAGNYFLTEPQGW